MNARSQVFEIALEARQLEEAIASLFHTILFHRSYGKFTYYDADRYYIGTVGYEDVDCDYIDHTYVRSHSPLLDKTVKQEVAAFSQELRLGSAHHPSSTLSSAAAAISSASGAAAAASGGASSSAAGSTAAGGPHHDLVHGAVKSTGAGACVGGGGGGGGAAPGGSGQVSLEFYQKRRKWPYWILENVPWEVWTIRTDLVCFTNEHDRQRWQEKVGEMLCDKVMYIAEVMNRHEYVPKMPNQADLEMIFDTSYPDVQPYLFKISYTTSGPSSPSVGSTVRRLIKDTLAI